MKKRNKPAKHSSRHIDIFGKRFVFPKGFRRKLNKRYPELRGKKLGVKDLGKVEKAVDNELKNKIHKERSV